MNCVYLDKLRQQNCQVNNDYILIITKTNIHKVVRVKDINFFEKINNRDVAVNISNKEYNNKEYIIANTMLKDIWKCLKNFNVFFRAHKSYIVNIEKIDYIKKIDDKYVVFFYGTNYKAIVSQRNMQKLYNMITRI